MDVGSLDAAEGGEQRDHQRGGDEEYRAGTEEIGNEPHETARRTPPIEGEALIASKTLGERCVADEAKADGGNRAAHEPASDPWSARVANTSGELAESAMISALQQP